MEQAADPFALPAFVISIISLVVAVIAATSGFAAFIWQVRTRTLGAHRVRVTVKSNQVVLSADSDERGPFIVVEVVNVGAAPVQMSGWMFVLPDGGGLYNYRPPLGTPVTPLPHMLLPGTKSLFFAESSSVAEHTKEIDERQIRVRVELATGQVAWSKRRSVKTS